MTPLDCGNPRCPMCNEHRGYQPATPLLTDPPQGGSGLQDVWHKVVVECEKILGCEDTAESPHASNLPNLVRNTKNDLEVCRQVITRFLDLHDDISSDPYTLESALYEVRKIVGRE